MPANHLADREWLRQRVLELHDQECTPKQIAARLGLTVTQVRDRIRRAGKVPYSDKFGVSINPHALTGVMHGYGRARAGHERTSVDELGIDQTLHRRRRDRWGRIGRTAEAHAAMLRLKRRRAQAQGKTTDYRGRMIHNPVAYLKAIRQRALAGDPWRHARRDEIQRLRKAGIKPKDI